MVILTCFHGRPKVSRAFLTHTTPILPIYAACSEGDADNIALCEEFGVVHCIVPNDPLGAKWNAALALVPDGEPVMIVGSDDFVAPEWVDLCRSALASGHHYITPASCGLYDLATGSACILRKNGHGVQYFGAGRVYSAELVERCAPLWTDGKDRALDSDALGRVMGIGYQRHTITTNRVMVTDVKTDDNLWTFDRWAWAGRHCPGDDVLWMVSDAARASLGLYPPCGGPL